MATVEVPGVVEATDFATFEHEGRWVVLRGPAGGKLGTLLPHDHFAVRAHPELFTPLSLRLGLDDELHQGQQVPWIAWSGDNN